VTARDLRAKAEEVCRAIEHDIRIEQQQEVTQSAPNFE
jgi:hypothetical protein